ncbi:MAG: hypothetical protein QME68_08215, partial [Elusimicrobiota bacterium]|nr:hypothetical protein [Elusimicrobiota bacterium]
MFKLKMINRQFKKNGFAIISAVVLSLLPSLLFAIQYIAENTTWTLINSPYIVDGEVRVLPGVTLTIEPGVEVMFKEGASINIYGTLKAEGEEGNLIIFTSNKMSPAPGDWGCISF